VKPWTEGEDFFVLDNPHLTAQQIAGKLGRTESSVAHRRRRLRGREGVTQFGKSGQAKTAWVVGTRPLVARTCIKCDRLLDASWFLRRGGQRAGMWYQDCRTCYSAYQAARRRQGRPGPVAALEAIAAERAWRSWEEYTEADLKILADPDRSLFQMALETGRTLPAVRMARQTYGLADSNPRLGDPAEVQWIIRLPEKAS
jgi:hypothetical protein